MLGDALRYPLATATIQSSPPHPSTNPINNAGLAKKDLGKGDEAGSGGGSKKEGSKREGKGKRGKGRHGGREAGGADSHDSVLEGLFGLLQLGHFGGQCRRLKGEEEVPYSWGR